MCLSQTFTLPGYDLAVETIGRDGIQKSEMERLTENLFFVWSHISPADKDCIANHWDKTKNAGYPVCMEIFESIYGNEEALSSTEPWGTTICRGAAIQYCWKICRLFPDKCLQALIAHEIGHVYQWAIGKNRLDMKREDLNEFKDLEQFPMLDNGLVEFHADKMALRWGFDPVLIHAFLFQRYNDREGKYVLRKKPRNETRAYNRAKKEHRWSPEMDCAILNLVNNS